MKKIEAIKNVLTRRHDFLRHLLLSPNLNNQQKNYYEGKKDGYSDALDLLNETPEAIYVELEDPA